MTTLSSDDLAALRGKLLEVRAALTAPGAAFEIRDEDVRGHRMPVFAARPRSLRELLDNSSRYADRLYLIDGDVRLTFADHLADVDALASWLQRERGVAPGDRVAIFAANRHEWVTSFWALASIGAVPAAFNGWWTAEEFAHAAALVGPALVIGDGPRLARVAETCTLPVVDMDQLAAHIAAHAGRRPDLPAVTEDAPAVLIFTSGTTGRPKAVTVPHRALCGFLQVNMLPEAAGRVLLGGTMPASPHDAPPSDDIVLVTSPLFHVSMLYGAVLMAVGKGSCFVLVPGRFDPERVLATIERERVTMWMALGSAATRVCGSEALRRYDTSSVRYIGVGGAPVSPAVQQALRAAFPTVAQSMGMGYTSTEAGAVVANISGPEFLAHPTSTGRVTRDDRGGIARPRRAAGRRGRTR